MKTSEFVSRHAAGNHPEVTLKISSSVMLTNFGTVCSPVKIQWLAHLQMFMLQCQTAGTGYWQDVCDLGPVQTVVSVISQENV